MITTLKLSLVGWLINLVKWKSIANESTAVWHFSIQFKLKSPTIIISQLLREGTLETWPLEQRNCKCHKEWAERGVTRESLQMNSSWTAQLCQLPGRVALPSLRSCRSESWVQPYTSPSGGRNSFPALQTNRELFPQPSAEKGVWREVTVTLHFQFSQIWALDVISIYLELWMLSMWNR